MSEHCPKCGAGYICTANGKYQFACLSHRYVLNEGLSPGLVESNKCVRRQLAQANGKLDEIAHIGIEAVAAAIKTSREAAEAATGKATP